MKNPECVVKVHTAARNEKISKAATARWKDPEYRETMSEFLRELRPMDNPKVRSKMSETQRLRMLSEWRDPKKRERRLESCRTPEFRETAAKGGKKTAAFWRSPEGRKIASMRSKKLWADERHRKLMSEKRKQHLLDHPDKKIQFVHAGWNAQRPTKLERRAIEILVDLPVFYTGDGTRWITTPKGRHLNPDFSVEGKKVILVDGDYWHPPNQKRSETLAYKSAGFSVLRLSEDQVKNHPALVLKRVQKFLSG